MISEKIGLEVDRITDFLRSSVADRHAILAVSGGIDSAVVFSLCSKAFDKDRLLAFFLPDSVTPKSDYDDVQLLKERTGIDVQTLNIDTIVNSLSSVTGARDRKSLGNMKSRVRMTLLYYFANMNNGIVVGTTNRTELFTGYFTKYGDGGVDIEPIQHLYKCEIVELAAILGIPESIIAKKPSAGLFEGQSDEEDLGVTYSHLDQVLMNFEKDGFELGTLKDQRVRTLYLESKHKRGLPLSLERTAGI